jgi:hypothetical protein
LIDSAFSTLASALFAHRLRAISADTDWEMLGVETAPDRPRQGSLDGIDNPGCAWPWIGGQQGEVTPREGLDLALLRWQIRRT